jgi:hypothetical protein
LDFVLSSALSITAMLYGVSWCTLIGALYVIVSENSQGGIVVFYGLSLCGIWFFG